MRDALRVILLGKLNHTRRIYFVHLSSDGWGRREMELLKFV